MRVYDVRNDKVIDKEFDRHVLENPLEHMLGKFIPYCDMKKKPCYETYRFECPNYNVYRLEDKRIDEIPNPKKD